MKPIFNRHGGVETDYGTISWDAVNNRPVDWQGAAGRIWEKLKVNYNITEPDSYVAPPPTADEIRTQSFLADADYDALLQQVITAMPNPIKTYVENNVTNLASARALLKKITLLLALIARK